jgi:hypothetical protein
MKNEILRLSISIIIVTMPKLLVSISDSVTLDYDFFFRSDPIKIHSFYYT